MKKFLCVFLALSIAFSMAACGGEAESPDESTSSLQPAETDSERDDMDTIGDIDVDSGLFDVTLTIPADFVGEVTQEQLDETARENGYKSVTLNDDGSVTYVVTKAQHEEMMNGIRQSIEESLSEIVGSEDYPSVVSVEANDDYTEYKIILNVEEVGISEGILAMGLYVFSGMYHVFNGTEAGNINIQYINETTGEVIQETNSNDME